MKISLHPAAESDIEEAAAFYESTVSPALATKFVSEFKRMSQLLLEFPEIGSPRSRGRRSFSMTLFPYAVIYRADSAAIKVLVVKHDSRRPGYGSSRV
jgi:toxin ParE1/3/4